MDAWSGWSQSQLSHTEYGYDPAHFTGEDTEAQGRRAPGVARAQGSLVPFREGAPPSEWARDKCRVNCSLPHPRPDTPAQRLARCTGSTRPKATQLVCDRAGPSPGWNPKALPRETSGLARPQSLSRTPTSPPRQSPSPWLGRGCTASSCCTQGHRRCRHLLHDGPTDLGRFALGRRARDRVAYVWASALHPGGPRTLGIRPLLTTSSSVASLATVPPGWLPSCPWGPSASPSSSQHVGEGAVPGPLPSLPVCSSQPPTSALVRVSASFLPCHPASRPGGTDTWMLGQAGPSPRSHILSDRRSIPSPL